MNEIKNKKRYIAFNTHIVLFVLLFLIFLGLSISCWDEGEIGIAVSFAFFTLLPVFVFFVSPVYFLFDDDAVQIVYHFGQKETITWNCVKSISESGSWFGPGSGFPCYEIYYPRQEKRPFFVRGEIPKTLRTKKLIKKYYKKDII